MTEDFDTAIRSILGQLIEAREDQNDADRRLHEYSAANRPPEVPDAFEDVDAFLDYHHRRQSYETDLRQHENALKKAKKEYADAAEQVLLFLPEGAPLRYTYQGERSELLGTEYVLVRKQGELVIESHIKAPDQLQGVRSGVAFVERTNSQPNAPRSYSSAPNAVARSSTSEQPSLRQLSWCAGLSGGPGPPLGDPTFQPTVTN